MTNELLGRDFFTLNQDKQRQFADALGLPLNDWFTDDHARKYGVISLEKLALQHPDALSAKEKLIAMGYLVTKLRKEKGNVAIVKLEGQLAKESAKRGFRGLLKMFKETNRGENTSE
jgi:hypothetical protein